MPDRLVTSLPHAWWRGLVSPGRKSRGHSGKRAFSCHRHERSARGGGGDVVDLLGAAQDDRPEPVQLDIGDRKTLPLRLMILADEACDLGETAVVADTGILPPVPVGHELSALVDPQLYWGVAQPVGMHEDAAVRAVAEREVLVSAEAIVEGIEQREEKFGKVAVGWRIDRLKESTPSPFRGRPRSTRLNCRDLSAVDRGNEDFELAVTGVRQLQSGDADLVLGYLVEILNEPT